MSLHLELKQRVDEHYAERLAAPARLTQDALLATLANGVDIELRFASDDRYAVSWRWGEAVLRIDTAPLHPALATFPNHLHDADGVLRDDRLTRPGAEPWDNARAVIDAVLSDPLLSA